MRYSTIAFLGLLGVFGTCSEGSAQFVPGPGGSYTPANSYISPQIFANPATANAFLSANSAGSNQVLSTYFNHPLYYRPTAETGVITNNFGSSYYSYRPVSPSSGYWSGYYGYHYAR